MEQNQESRNKPMHIWSKEPRIFNREKIVFLINGIGKTGISHKNVKLDPYNSHKD